MFRLNEVVETKNGEKIKPFSVQGNIVLCADSDGNTVKRALTDFEFSPPKEKEVVSIIPSKNTVSPKEEIEPEPEPEPEPDPEPDPEPEPEPEENTGSIWDNIDDGYI